VIKAEHRAWRAKHELEYQIVLLRDASQLEAGDNRFAPYLRMERIITGPTFKRAFFEYLATRESAS
jgi:hypothetical protein